MKRQTASLLKSRCYTLCYEPFYMLMSDHMSLTDAVSWHVFFLLLSWLLHLFTLSHRMSPFKSDLVYIFFLKCSSLYHVTLMKLD